MNEKINIMVGGPEALIPYDQVADHRSETWLGVDLGATRLLEHGIMLLATLIPARLSN